MAWSHPLTILHTLAAGALLLTAVDLRASEPKEADVSPIHIYTPNPALPPGAVVRLGSPCFRPGEPVPCLAFSPDGKWLASGGLMNWLRIWDAASGKELLRLSANKLGLICDVAISPDGKRLAWASETEQVLLWEPDPGKRVQQLKGHRHTPQAVAFSPDSKLLATGTHDGTIHLWKAADGKEDRTWQSDETDITSLAFFPDGKTLVSGGKGIRLWETATGKEIDRGKKLRRAKGRAVVSPDGKLLATGNIEEPFVRLWDAASGKELRRLKGWEGGVSCLRFSPDGRTLACAGYGGDASDPSSVGEIGLWEVATGKQVQRIRRHFAAVCPLAFSPDGKVLAAGYADGIIRLWQPSTGKELTPPGGHLAPLLSVGYSPDGKIVATASADRTVRLWDATTGKSLGSPLEHGDDLISGFVFSADGKRLASAGSSGSIAVWDVAKGQRIRRLPGHKMGVLSVMFSPDGKELVSGGEDRTARVWELSTGEEKQRLAVDSTPFATPVFSPAGQALTAARDGDKIHIWDVRSGKKVRTSTRTAGGDEWINLGSDGRTLISVTDRKTLRMWDSVSGKDWYPPLAIPEAGPDKVLTILFSPDGRTLATLVEPDVGVRMWELATGKERCQIESIFSRQLAFSPDGRFLLSGDMDMTVLVWDVHQLGRGSSFAKEPLPARDLEQLWADLAGQNAREAYRAICLLVASPREAVDFAAKHLQPIAPADGKRIAALIADLDSNDYAVRDKATRDLERLGELAAPALEKVLANPPSAEAGKRLQRLLDRATALTPRQLRHLRAVEMLELAGTAEARRLLKKLASGMPEARLTQESQNALQRLSR